MEVLREVYFIRYFSISNVCLSPTRVKHKCFCAFRFIVVCDQASNQLGTSGGRRVFWGRTKFYIDGTYANNGYAYNLSLHAHIFSGGGENYSRGHKPPASSH